MKAQTTRIHSLARLVASRGFTLIETMVTVSMVAVLVGISAPSMSAFMKNGRLASSANEVLRSFQLARTESIKRQRNVVICASSNGTSCNYGDFERWIVFEDTNGSWQRESTEELIEDRGKLDGSLKVSTDNDGVISFGPSGFAMPPGPSGKIAPRYIGLCDDRGNVAVGATESAARAVLIDTTGRARVSKKISDVQAAGNCR